MNHDVPPFSRAALGRSALAALLLLAASATIAQERKWETDIVRDTFGYGPGTPSDVAWDELEQGCGARDCIPSIDDPKFVPASEADFLADQDIVMAIELDGEARAYPVAILNYHEIVNDEIAGRPVAVTYCPLCGSGLVFGRRFEDGPVEFGVSGLLRKNDLVLYDRATESLWQQITGRAFAGPMRGQELEVLPVAMTRWGTWRAAHPGTRVLSTDTGFDRPYANKTPYGDYDSNERLLFPVALDRRLHPKTVVYGVETGDGSYAVTEDALQAAKKIEQPGDPGLAWELTGAGEVRARRLDSGEPMVAHRMFWFAWYSFHVDTQLHDAAREE